MLDECALAVKINKVLLPMKGWTGQGIMRAHVPRSDRLGPGPWVTTLEWLMIFVNSFSELP